MRLFFRLSLLLTVLFASLSHAELADTLEKIKPAIVGVGVHTPTSRPQNILAGSGFVIGDGLHIVTNKHVLPETLDHALKQQIVVFTGSGKTAKVRMAELVFTSKEFDLAVIKISGTPLPAMTLAKDEFKREGSYIAFTGFPIGTVLGLYPVTHRGIIASITPTVVPAANAQSITLKMLKRMKNPYLVYQLDATAYPGNSGSAMYDINSGEVLGIINKVFVQASKEGVISNPSGITYAIPVRYLNELLRKHQLSW